MKHRLAIVTGIPAPHQDPLFERLAQHPDLELRVLYCGHPNPSAGWAEDPERLQFDHELVPNWSPASFRQVPLLGSINPGILTSLRRFQPDYVVLYGYSQLSHWLAYAYCRLRKVPFALRGDSNVWMDDGAGLAVRCRRRLLRHLVSRADAVLPVGSANAYYWQRYGATPEQSHFAPFAVDNERLFSLASSVPEPKRFRFVFAGRLVRRKGVGTLIKAFESIVERSNAELVMIGAGPEMEALQSMQSPAARARTRWTGRLSHKDAIREVAAGTVFVFPPAREPWGMVVNEAMALGLPVIAHRRCGAAIDLVDESTGWLLPDERPESLVEKMSEALADPDLTRFKGQAALKRIERWSLDRSVRGFLAAIQSRPPRPKQEPATDWRKSPLITKRCPAS